MKGTFQQSSDLTCGNGAEAQQRSPHLLFPPHGPGLSFFPGMKVSKVTFLFPNQGEDKAGTLQAPSKQPFHPWEEPLLLIPLLKFFCGEVPEEKWLLSPPQSIWDPQP